MLLFFDFYGSIAFGVEQPGFFVERLLARVLMGSKCWSWR